MNMRSTLLPFLLAAGARSQETVVPRAETTPVRSSGDAADDAAIWVDPDDPARSVVIATDKQAGLEVYDLAGNRLQSVPGGRPNNVDLRRDFPLAGELVTLVATGDRSRDRLKLYVLDPDTRTLADIAARDIRMGIDVYGCCLYRSPFTQRLFFFGTSKDGLVEQWRLFDHGSGRVDALRVRTFDVGGQSEGCVADDGTGFLFVGEESVGIWRYGAEPAAGDARILLDSTDSDGNLDADVEGLAIYYAAGGRGYLVASSQGDDSFSVYDRRPPHRHLLHFELGAGAGNVDAVTNCDGLDVVNLSLGSAYPDGLLVVQDGTNPGGNQNFKLVRWSDVAAAANPPLLVDATYDPLGSGCASAASATNRAGANPSILRSLSLPSLGSHWRLALDCAGHASAGAGVIVGYARPGGGIFTGAGEILVDRSSARLFHLVAGHEGGIAPFDVAVPNDLVFCGMSAHVQGICWGQPGRELSNSVDARLGF